MQGSTTRYPGRKALHVLFAITIAMSCFRARTTQAAVTSYATKSAYIAAAAPQSEITFGEFPIGTIVTNQYAPLGVIFDDGDDQIASGIGLFGDSVGVPAANNTNGLVTLSFASPINSVAADFPGQLNISLFSGATLVGTSATFGGSGAGFFGGVQSTVPFDKALLQDLFDNHVSIDNVYFQAIPEPTELLGACAVAAFPLAARRRARVN